MESWKAQLETTKTEFAEFLEFSDGGNGKGDSTLRILEFLEILSRKGLSNFPQRSPNFLSKNSPNFPQSSRQYLQKNSQQLEIFLQNISTIEILEANTLRNFVYTLLFQFDYLQTSLIRFKANYKASLIL